ncbi:hypothetical protein AMTR_s00127p00099910 [Amborella trichopoda]|uniref:Aminotransferase-like plant mobile domain-containing protein n=1 Tax=Amborella trichopoda TaxID=13333 RepID=W1NNN8_AMBTC|nr:hypothetical protein AMTR_s00127p00099910 [Amborella trichopoda]
MWTSPEYAKIENDKNTPDCKLVFSRGFFVDCRSHLFAIRKWAALLTPGQRQVLARICLWEVCWIKPFCLDLALITKLCLRYRPQTYSILLRCGELALTLEDVPRILRVQSEGEPFLSIPQGMSTSYASDCKELLGISLEKIRGRHDSEIHLGKLRWEFTGVPHSAGRMMGGHAPQVSVSVGRRLSHKGKALVGEAGVWATELVQGESSHPLSKGVARSSGDAEGVRCDIPDLGDGSAFLDEDTMPPQASLTDEEWREQEREMIQDEHERAMI